VPPDLFASPPSPPAHERAMNRPAKHWIIAEPDLPLAESLARAHDLPPPLGRVLVNRGLEEATAAGYLEPRLDSLGDPFRLPGMAAAVERIGRALAARETILVFGDYDVDGVASSALLNRVFSALGGEVRHFIPHRIDDGYGLQVDSLRQCLEAHAPGLVVTVDCGTGSVEAVREAAAAGVDVIVTDHHEVSTTVAPALAVVNPKLASDPADHGLAGVGVAFKLCHALLKRGRAEGWPGAARLDLRDHLDLVSLGTIADMVPLRGENRVFARQGLARLGRQPSPGLAALLEVAGVRETPGCYHVGFLLGPRLNAAGRMDHPDAALRLLLARDAKEANPLARELDEANHERQAVEEDTLRAALKALEARYVPERDFALVLDGAGWHPGVIGIVAARLVQRFHRPTAVIAVQDNGLGKASCRSIEGFDFTAHLRAAAGHLRKFGGHAMAAGFEIEGEEIPAFRDTFLRLSEATLRGRDLRAQLRVDAWLEPSDLDESLVQATERLAPFGLGNPAPVWALADVQVSRAAWMGSGQKHFKLTLAGLPSSVEAVAFNVPGDTLPEGRLDIAFKLRTNTWNGVTRLQLQLEDWRPA
jgi:single-stranded-DNA-specific exonuclease